VSEDTPEAPQLVPLLQMRMYDQRRNLLTDICDCNDIRLTELFRLSMFRRLRIADHNFQPIPRRLDKARTGVVHSSFERTNSV